ncbi:hypothetical protein FLM48_17110 [Shewanella sp. Scap07]|uniref:DUF6795 domain-containing protein n=1 Tax=Shewanella sp. Scap07 TaxID=2589987 RepID=UPI0015BCC918|nr:DUF6795 domain-containing protein [Shewanella sp. Scap07]QLE86639.1 hypothetical protein FLM48_17110 [Shewanella sp. Scap07]
MLGLLRKTYTVELCPEVQGRLTHNNLPIQNQTVTRSLTYNDEEEVDECVTDSDGVFYFPAKSIKSKLPGNIFHEPVIRQIIFVEFQEQEPLIWFANQREIDTPKVFIRLMSKLNAELTAEEQVYEFENKEFSASQFRVRSLCLLESYQE